MEEQQEIIAQKNPYELFIEDLEKFLVEYDAEKDSTRKLAVEKHKSAEDVLELWRTGNDDRLIDLDDLFQERLLEMWKPFREDLELDKAVVDTLNDLLPQQGRSLRNGWENNVLNENDLFVVKVLFKERLISAWLENACGEKLQVALTQELVNNCIKSFKTQGGVLENVDLQFRMKNCLQEKNNDGEFPEDLQKVVSFLQIAMLQKLGGNITDIDILNEETLRIILYLWVRPARQVNAQQHQVNHGVKVDLGEKNKFLLENVEDLTEDVCRWIDEEAGTVIQCLILDAGNKKYTARFLEETIDQFLNKLFEDKYSHLQSDVTDVLEALCQNICKEQISGYKNDLYSMLRRLAVEELIRLWSGDNKELNADVIAWLKKNDCPELLEYIERLQELCVPKLSQMIENKITKKELSVDALIASLSGAQLDPFAWFEHSKVVKELPTKFHDALEKARASFDAMLEFVNGFPEQYLVGNLAEYRKHYEIACQDMTKKPLSDSKCVSIEKLRKQEQKSFEENILESWEYFPRSLTRWFSNTLTKKGNAVEHYFYAWCQGQLEEGGEALSRSIGELVAELYVNNELDEALQMKIKEGIFSQFLFDYQYVDQDFVSSSEGENDSEEEQESEWNEVFYNAFKKAWDEKSLDGVIEKELGRRFATDFQEHLKKGKMLTKEENAKFRKCALEGVLHSWRGSQGEKYTDLENAIVKFVEPVFYQTIEHEKNQDELSSCIVKFSINRQVSCWLEGDAGATENLKALFIGHVFSEDNIQNHKDVLIQFAIGLLYIAWNKKDPSLTENVFIKEWLEWNADPHQVREKVFDDSLGGIYFEKFNALPVFIQEKYLPRLKTLRNFGQEKVGVVSLTRLDHLSIEELQNILQDKKNIQTLDLSGMDLTLEDVLTLYEAAGRPKTLNVSSCYLLSFDELRELDQECESLIAKDLPQIGNRLLFEAYPILKPFSDELKKLDRDHAEAMCRYLKVPFGEFKKVVAIDEVAQKKALLSASAFMIERSTDLFDILADKFKNNDNDVFKIFLSLPMVKKEVESLVLAYPIDPSNKSVCQLAAERLVAWANNEYTQIQFSMDENAATERRNKIVKKAFQAIIYYAGHEHRFKEGIVKTRQLMMKLGDEDTVINYLLEEYKNVSDVEVAEENDSLIKQQKKGIAILLTHFHRADKEFLDVLLDLYQEDIERNEVALNLVQCEDQNEELFNSLYENDLINVSPRAAGIAIAKFEFAKEKIKDTLRSEDDKKRGNAVSALRDASYVDHESLKMLQEHYNDEGNPGNREVIIFRLCEEKDAAEQYADLFSEAAADQHNTIWARRSAIRHLKIESLNDKNADLLIELLSQKDQDVRGLALVMLSELKYTSKKIIGLIKKNDFDSSDIIRYLKATVDLSDEAMYGVLVNIDYNHSSAQPMLEYLLEVQMEGPFSDAFKAYLIGNISSYKIHDKFLNALGCSTKAIKHLWFQLNTISMRSRNATLRDKCQKLQLNPGIASRDRHFVNKYDSQSSNNYYNNKGYNEADLLRDIKREAPWKEVLKSVEKIKHVIEAGGQFPLAKCVDDMIRQFQENQAERDSGKCLDLLSRLTTDEITRILPQLDIRSAIELIIRHESDEKKLCGLAEKIPCRQDEFEKALLILLGKSQVKNAFYFRIMSLLFRQKHLSSSVLEGRYLHFSDVCDSMNTYVSNQRDLLSPLMDVATLFVEKKSPNLKINSTDVEDLKSLFFGLDYYANFVPQQQTTPVDIKGLVDFTRQCLSFCDAAVINFEEDRQSVCDQLADINVTKSTSSERKYATQPVVVITQNKEGEKNSWGCVVVMPHQYFVNGIKITNEQPYTYFYCDNHKGKVVSLLREYFEVHDCNPFSVNSEYIADSGWWVLYTSFMTLLLNGYEHHNTMPKPSSVNVLRYCFPAIAAKEQREVEVLEKESSADIPRKEPRGD